MPDAITPVGAMVQPPNALGTLSSILGIQQQRQALQGQAAVVQQEQLKAQQASGVQNFFQSFDPSQHMSADGTVDLDSALQDPAFKSSGNAKPQIMQALLDVKNRQLTSKQQLTTLNGANLSQLSSVVGALAKDPDVMADRADPQTGVNAGRAKVNAAIDNFAQLGPDAARVAAIYKPILQHVPPQKLSGAIQSLQMQAQDVAGQQAQQNPGTGMVATGSNIYPYTFNKSTGVPQFTGQNIPAGIPPGWNLTEDPVTHNKYIVNQQTGQAQPLPGAGSAPQNAPPQRAPGEGEAQQIAAKGVSERVQQAQVGANSLPQTIDALSRARDILEQPGNINTGALFDRLRGVKNYLSSVGVDTQGATDANSLLKNLARYEANRATAVGLGQTDAARALAHDGSPNTALDNKALLGIINQSMATERAMASYANVQARTTNPAKWQENEAKFRSIPNLIEGYQYGATRNPTEANQFLGEHRINPTEMAATRKAIKDFEAQQ